MPRRDEISDTTKTLTATLNEMSAIERGALPTPVRAVPGSLAYDLERARTNDAFRLPTPAELVEVKARRAAFLAEFPKYEAARVAFLAAGERLATAGFRLSDGLKSLGVEHNLAEPIFAHVGEVPLSEASAWPPRQLVAGDAGQWAAAMGAGVSLDTLIEEARLRT